MTTETGDTVTPDHEEPPNDTILMDRLGIAWQRRSEAWYRTGVHEQMSWDELLISDFKPFMVVYLPEGKS